MEKSLLSLVIFILLQNFFGHTISAQTKHALIIANSDYNEAKTGWRKLSSDNDVPLIESSLRNQNFKTEQIRILRNVTAAQIIDGFENLRQKVKPGDIVVIHYSGHGVQLQDDNDDEADGLDEALVPIDAVYDENDLNTGKYLRDDKLGELFYDIRKKLGEQGHLLVFLDSCHSGSGSRGRNDGAIARGDKPPLVTKAFNEKKSTLSYSQSLADSPALSRGGPDKSLSKMIMFAGASSNESNYETFMDGQSVGSLSFAVSKALNQLRAKDTYRQVFAKVRSEMAVAAPRQSPVVEGDINYQFFAGDLKKQEPYFELKRRLDATSVLVDAGTTAGVNVGDIFILDTAGTELEKDRFGLITGEITDADHFSSTLKVKGRLPLNFVPASYWAYCTQTSYRSTTVGIKTDIANSEKASYKSLTDSLEIWPFVKLNPVAEAVNAIAKSSGNGTAILEIPDSGLPFLDMKPINIKTSDGIVKFKSALLAFAHSRFLRSLQLTSDDIKIELSLVRVKAFVQSETKFEIQKIYDSPSDTITRVFSENDQFLIKVSNVGKVRAYYNIIAIQPDNRITPIIPESENSEVNSYVLEAGDSKILKARLLNGFFQPYGTEMLKIFATSRPINFFAVIDSQESITSRGDSNPLETIMSSYNSSTRGPRITGTSNAGATFDYVYTIVPLSQ